jgi:hypothetical protein
MESSGPTPKYAYAVNLIMRTLSLSSALMMSFVMLLAGGATSSNCWAVIVYFNGSVSTDFLNGANWNPVGVPGNNLVDVYSIDDGLSSTFSAGSATVQGLRVGSVAKEHQFGNTHFGRLTLSGSSLSVIGLYGLNIGRERENNPFGGDYDKNSRVDAADYVVWRDSLGSTTVLRADGIADGTIDHADYDFWRAHFGTVVKGGEIIMTGASNVTAYGLVVGERTKALLSIGPTALVEVRTGDTSVVPNQCGGTDDMRIGSYGPAYDDFGAEPGLDGNGLVDVQGTLNAKDVFLSNNGAKGEIRLSGGVVNLNGALRMDMCEVCQIDPVLLAQRSSKLTIIGSSGSFKVGLDPDPLVFDSMPPNRNLLAASATATFSFTADAGGVTPITVVDNPGERSGTAYINGANLQLNLDAYTSASPLTLIDAPAGLVVDPAPADPTPHFHLVGSFGTNVTFLGNRWADVNYDYANGNVYLNNFRIGPGVGAGSLASSAVPEPSSLALIPLALCLLLFVNYRIDRRTAHCWGFQCERVRA